MSEARGGHMVGNAPVNLMPRTASRFNDRIDSARIAIAHDYLTQRGGAERVVLDIAAAFPDASVHTSLFHPEGTFPEFSALLPTTSILNHVALFRRHHRLALPLLAGSVSRMHIDADVTVASSSGWAHGISTTGKKVVYCHAPARWLYQTAVYLGRDRQLTGPSERTRALLAQNALATMVRPLKQWDRRAARSADIYLANSTVTRAAIAAAYGIEAEILPPPPALWPGGDEKAIEGVEPGYFLCVARLLPYKNVDAVIAAINRVPEGRLIVVGEGPDFMRLTSLIEELRGGKRPRVMLFGRATDAELRWLYRNSVGLVAASIEDYGLTPLEAAAFGKPTVALAAGGYLDTVRDGRTGVMFASLHPEALSRALIDCTRHRWDEDDLALHAESFGPARFRSRLRAVVAGVLRR